MPAANTPEELELLLEDAFLTRDLDAFGQLFEAWGVLNAGERFGEARGTAAIARTAAAMWDREHGYVAHPARVLQARNTALVIAGSAVNVAHRCPGGGWRYVIAALDQDRSQRRGPDYW